VAGPDLQRAGFWRALTAVAKLAVMLGVTKHFPKNMKVP
jgi:hypothetical protein